VSRLKVLVLSRVVFIAHSIHVNTGLLWFFLIASDPFLKIFKSFL
jgi:hypothetical protein